MKIYLVAGVAVIFMASCKASKPATIAPDYTVPKSSAGVPALNMEEIARLGLTNDTIVINLKIVMPVERQRLEAELKKKEKAVQTWKYIAAGMLLIAGGSYFLGL